MGATAIYAIPWPELTDPPNGSAQMKALADRVDTVLSTVQGSPSIPTFAARAQSDTGLPGNRVYSVVHFSGQRILGTGFIDMPAPPAASWSFTRTGVYEIVCKMRLSAASAPGSYAQLYGGASGALTNMVTLAPWGGTICELLLHEYVEVTAGMVGVASNLQIQIDANVTYSIAGASCRLLIKRLGEVGSVVAGPG